MFVVDSHFHRCIRSSDPRPCVSCFRPAISPFSLHDCCRLRVLCGRVVAQRSMQWIIPSLRGERFTLLKLAPTTECSLLVGPTPTDLGCINRFLYFLVSLLDGLADLECLNRLLLFLCLPDGLTVIERLNRFLLFVQYFDITGRPSTFHFLPS